jgi:hypothetical protein
MVTLAKMEKSSGRGLGAFGGGQRPSRRRQASVTVDLSEAWIKLEHTKARFLPAVAGREFSAALTLEVSHEQAADLNTLEKDMGFSMVLYFCCTTLSYFIVTQSCRRHHEKNYRSYF